MKLKKIIQESNSPKNLNEAGETIATGAIREIADDLMVKTEMLIDELYGEVDAQEFRKAWVNKVALPFEKSIRNIMRKMSQ